MEKALNTGARTLEIVSLHAAMKSFQRTPEPLALRVFSFDPIVSAFATTCNPEGSGLVVYVIWASLQPATLAAWSPHAQVLPPQPNSSSPFSRFPFGCFSVAFPRTYNFHSVRTYKSPISVRAKPRACNGEDPEIILTSSNLGSTPDNSCRMERRK